MLPARVPRAGRRTTTAIIVVLAAAIGLGSLACVGEPAVAQAFIFTDEARLDVVQGEPANATVTIRNAVNRSMLGFARVDGSLAAASTISETEFRLPPGGTHALGLTVRGAELDVGEHGGVIRVTLVDQESGRTQRLRVNVTADVRAPLLVFDAWENPLPDPLGGPFGVFLIEAVAWAAAGYVVVKINDVILARFMRRAPEWLKNKVLAKVDRPLFLLVVVAGASTAWRVFPDEGAYGVARTVLGAVAALLIAFVLYRLVDAFLVIYEERVAHLTESKLDDVAVPVLRKVALVVIVIFGFVVLFQSFGVDLGFLVAGGVVVGLIASTAMGPSLSNLFAGLFIMVDRPFREGDDIRLDTGEVCRVERIGLRTTRLYYYRNHEYIVMPNNDLATKPVVNLLYPDDKYRLHIEVGVAYGSSVPDVKRVLAEVAQEHDEISLDEQDQPTVMFDGFGDSALMFRLVATIRNARDRFRIASEMRFRIEERFREEDITIPFPQRTVWLNEAAAEAANGSRQ